MTHVVSLYDGRNVVAALRDAGPGKVTAFRVDLTGRRIKIGVYATRAIALRAIREMVPPTSEAAR